MYVGTSHASPGCQSQAGRQRMRGSGKHITGYAVSGAASAARRPRARDGDKKRKTRDLREGREKETYLASEQQPRVAPPNPGTPGPRAFISHPISQPSTGRKQMIEHPKHPKLESCFAATGLGWTGLVLFARCSCCCCLLQVQSDPDRAWWTG